MNTDKRSGWVREWLLSDWRRHGRRVALLWVPGAKFGANVWRGCETTNAAGRRVDM
jgi:hypothetical protein